MSYDLNDLIKPKPDDSLCVGTAETHPEPEVLIGNRHERRKQAKLSRKARK